MIDISSMTLEEKITQTKVVLVEDKENVNVQAGGVFFGGQIITDADEDSLDDFRIFIKKLHENSNIPPLITSDFEYGCGGMIKGLTSLPFMMGLGATNDEELAYEYGKITALEARSVGANWTFSPVSDLNINKRNPLVNTRAVSDNTELAVKMLKNVVKGMQDNGLAACAKHFPGDGLDYRDQHLVPTYNSLSVEEWKKKSGKVFQELIDDGVNTIMAGHIGFPAYTKERDEEFGLAYPATLSYELITTLLKNEMEFDGVVVTDALNMGGFKSWYDTKEIAEIESFKAGCDMMLWPSPTYDENMKKAIETGYISIERLDDAVTRVLELKKKLGLFDEKKPLFESLTDKDKEYINNTKERLFQKSVTLIRDTANLLPIDAQKVKTVCLIPVANCESAFELAEHLKELLEHHGVEVLYRKDYGWGDIGKDIDADIILYAMFSQTFKPVGFIDYYDTEGVKLIGALGHKRKKTMGVSFGSPYFFEQYFANCSTFVNAYSMLEASVDAFVKAVFGEEQFNDFSPVNI